MPDVTPYASAMQFVAGTKPTWLDTYNGERHAAYGLYEDMYWNNPNSYRLLLRGTDDKPIYIPTARKIVNVMSRYVARGFKVNIDLGPEGSDDELETAIFTFGEFFKRERFMSKFASQKRYGLMRGDWAFFIYADPDKPEGSRISIKGIDPRLIFPIHDDIDPDRVIGYDMIEQIKVGDKEYIKRQRWVKQDHEDHPSFGAPPKPEGYPIYYISEILEVENWQDPEKVKVFKTELSALFPDEITQLPIYHIRNNDEEGNPFGSSELRGLEQIIAGVNQAVSDEDIALAMAGLGLYATDSGAPVDEEGEETDWLLGPKRVVEVGEGRKFERVSGVASVEPSQTHIGYLEDKLDENFGISDVATGQMDVTVAESGIALALRMGPIIDAAEEKDLHIKDVLNQMFYDLKSWFKVYEGIDMTNIVIEAFFGEKLPTNRKDIFTELQDLYTNGIITVEYYIDQLQEKLGYKFPPKMIAAVIAAAEAMMGATSRLEQEAGGDDATLDGTQEDNADDEGI